MLSETEGVRVLTEAFRARGFAIDNDVAFDEDGVSFSIDGWDARARVGFEYRTHEAADRVDLTDDEIDLLGARIERGELFLLIVDDTRIPDAATLAGHAARFLDIVATKQAVKTQTKQPAKKKPAKKKPAKKQPAKKQPAKRQSAKKRASSTSKRGR